MISLRRLVQTVTIAMTLLSNYVLPLQTLAQPSGDALPFLGQWEMVSNSSMGEQQITMRVSADQGKVAINWASELMMTRNSGASTGGSPSTAVVYRAPGSQGSDHSAALRRVTEIEDVRWTEEGESFVLEFQIPITISLNGNAQTMPLNTTLYITGDELTGISTSAFSQSEIIGSRKH